MTVYLEDPFRLKVLKQMTLSFEQNVQGSEFNYSLSGRVFRGINKFGTEVEVPFLSILEPPVAADELPTPDASGHFRGNWNLLLQGFLENDRKNPTDPGYYMLCDVKKRLGMERTRLVEGAANDGDRFRNPFGMGKHRDGIATDRKSNYIEGISFGLGVVRPPDETVSDTAYFWLPVTLKIVEDTLNPFM